MPGRRGQKAARQCPPLVSLLNLRGPSLVPSETGVTDPRGQLSLTRTEPDVIL